MHRARIIGRALVVVVVLTGDESIAGSVGGIRVRTVHGEDRRIRLRCEIVVIGVIVRRECVAADDERLGIGVGRVAVGVAELVRWHEVVLGVEETRQVAIDVRSVEEGAVAVGAGIVRRRAEQAVDDIR